MTDFEKWPEYFPRVAESIRVINRDGNNLKIEAIVKSFGQKFLVKMKYQILPERGFISDNENSKLGISGHEEFLLSENQEETVINYTYKVFIRKPWLRVVAKPLISWYSMKYWEKAVIDELKRLVEK